MKDHLRKFVCLVECNSPTHKGCWRVQDQLMKHITGMLESYLTRTEIDGHMYCICTSGLITDNTRDEITLKFHRVKWGHNRVKHIKMLVDQR